MIDNKILDQILLSLADQYESGRTDHCVSLTVTTPEEFEPFRETMAALRAEGSVIMSPWMFSILYHLMRSTKGLKRSQTSAET